MGPSQTSIMDEALYAAAVSAIVVSLIRQVVVVNHLTTLTS